MLYTVCQMCEVFVPAVVLDRVCWMTGVYVWFHQGLHSVRCLLGVNDYIHFHTVCQICVVCMITSCFKQCVRCV